MVRNKHYISVTYYLYNGDDDDVSSVGTASSMKAGRGQDCLQP